MASLLCGFCFLAASSSVLWLGWGIISKTGQKLFALWPEYAWVRYNQSPHVLCATYLRFTGTLSPTTTFKSSPEKRYTNSRSVPVAGVCRKPKPAASFSLVHRHPGAVCKAPVPGQDTNEGPQSLSKIGAAETTLNITVL